MLNTGPTQQKLIEGIIHSLFISAIGTSTQNNRLLWLLSLALANAIIFH